MTSDRTPDFANEVDGSLDTPTKEIEELDIASISIKRCSESNPSLKANYRRHERVSYFKKKERFLRRIETYWSRFTSGNVSD